MRGKRHRIYLAAFRRRNIPAYAGKTVATCPTGALATEHPRVCGENFFRIYSAHCALGTSPRMRGKHPKVTNHTPSRRNIPAYAGKTGRNVRRGVRRREHPRVCGENPASSSHRRSMRGTSPRMRGKRSCFHRGTEFDRNIPAYAGKTITHMLHSSLKTEHPRVCGENPININNHARLSGTSPRMRGKRVGWLSSGWGVRNIPAYAGKTQSQVSGCGGQGEHPRVCGENLHRVG